MNKRHLQISLLVIIAVAGAIGYFVLPRNQKPAPQEGTTQSPVVVPLSERIVACKESPIDQLRDDPRIKILDTKYTALRRYNSLDALIYQDVAYFVGGDQFQHIYVLDLRSDTNPYILLTTTEPIIKLNIVNGRLYYSTSAQTGKDNGQLHAVDLNNSRQLWQFQATERIFTTPLLLSNILYFGDNNGQLYAVDSVNGKEKWNFKAEAFPVSDPISAQNRVWFGTGGGHLYGMNPQSGVAEKEFKTEYSWIESVSFKNGLFCFTGMFSAREGGERAAMDIETGEIYKAD